MTDLSIVVLLKGFILADRHDPASSALALHDGDGLFLEVHVEAHVLRAPPAQLRGPRAASVHQRRESAEGGPGRATRKPPEL